MNKLKMSLLITLLMASPATVLAADPFAEVAPTDAAYQAAVQLETDGFLSPGSMNAHMTRYDMAIITGKAVAREEQASPAQRELIARLNQEYGEELKGIKRIFSAGSAAPAAENASADEKKQTEVKYPQVKFGGNVHVRWDSDKTEGSTGSTDGRHMYLSLEGDMQVNKDWHARFQTENKNRYLSHHNQGDETQFGQRIWLEGKSGVTGITVGRRWWWLGQGLMFAHSMDGVKLDVPLSKNTSLSAFYMHPDGVKGRTDAPADVANGVMGGNGTSYMSLGRYDRAELFGVNLAARRGRLSGSLMLGGNGHTVDSVTGNYADVTRWGETGLSYQADKNWRFGAAYSRTNAPDYKSSWRLGVHYKDMHGEQPGTYGVGLTYLHLGRYGTLLHDDFWGYQWADSNILSLDMEVCVAPHLVWRTYYSWQTRNLSGKGGYWQAIAADYAAPKTKRRVFFTELAAYF